MVEVRFSVWMPNGPVSDLAVVILDDGAERDTLGCLGRERLRWERGLDAQPPALNLHPNLDWRSGFQWAHVRPIVVKTVERPGQGWREVRFDVTGRIGVAEKGLEAGSLPKAIGVFGAGGFGQAKMFQLARHIVVQDQLLSVVKGRADGNRLDPGTRRIRMAIKRKRHLEWKTGQFKLGYSDSRWASRDPHYNGGLAYHARFGALYMSDEAHSFDLENFLETLTQRPGVYRMLDERGEVIYVGKAKNLRKRVGSYFSSRDASPKQRAMVGRIRSIDVSVTHTEAEALLLESQLIKRHKPRYNITLRDDKSYPSIYVSTHQDFPRLSFHRGAKAKQGRYFGPYPSALAVRDSLKLLQKVFPVRQCRDSFYENRTRPCLEYQIERCTAPCVGLIDAEAYAQDVRDTIMFLDGDGSRLINELVSRMETASAALDFERAARYRDQIATLRTVLAKQAVHGEQGDLDIIACAIEGSVACVQMVFVRGGQQIGDRAFFPAMVDEHEPGGILQAFIGQYYLGKPIPREILVSHPLPDGEIVEEALTNHAGHGVQISPRSRGERQKRVQLALTNADNALAAKLANRRDLHARFLALGEELCGGVTPRRLECFDISHTQGDQTVASCVVFDRQGPVKSAYRRFNIQGVVGGDDYAALAQAVGRRYQRIKQGEYEAPDILFIDGGKGQVKAVKDTLVAMDLSEIRIVGVAKGPDRKPGMENLFPAGWGAPLVLSPHSPALLLIQQIRDEAHRFAITGHRQRRAKAKQQSSLDGIPGLGPKRRQQLLRQFGGLREVTRAGVDALGSVEGISHQLAQRIYDNFHDRDS